MSHRFRINASLRNMFVVAALAVAGTSAWGAPLTEGTGASNVAKTAHITSQLVAERASVVPGQTIRVALDQTIIDHWHTYWVNPGETGLPTRIKWTLPPGWTAGPIQWPTPKKMMVGPIVNYGYDGQLRLLTQLRAPADADLGKPVTLVAEANWLVCEQMCVPERVKLTMTLDVAAQRGAPVSGAAPIFRQAEAALPRTGAVKVAFVQDGQASRLEWASDAPVRQALFFAESKDAIAPNAAQTLSKEGSGYRLTFAQKPALSGPLKGILSIDGRGVAVSATPVAKSVLSDPAADAQAAADEAANASATDPAANAQSAVTEEQAVPAPAVQSVAPLGETPPAGQPVAGDAESMSVWQAAILALLGGAILNLMPCVFPVLSMKAFALASHGRAHARRHGFAYGAGVILCFVAIAAVLLALRGAGSQIGWGFQLQSPIVVAVLAYVMLLLALSMSGVFVLGTSVMGVGSDLAGRDGLSGSFFTGVLATVVAAPCTAPFMGAAVGYALLQPWWVSLVVFVALGAGMALPFVLLTCFDPLLKLIPRPGMWMERLKQILAFPLYATAAWLVWVLTNQTGSLGLATAFAGCLLIAFAAYLYGQQFRGKWIWLGRAVAVASVLGAVALPTTLSVNSQAVAKTGAEGAPVAFSEKAVAAELAAGRPVFVDFTAAWCITCLANERIALSRDAVQQTMQRKSVTFMTADWTNQDDAITVALQKFGRSGVPLYLLYTPGQAKPQILPQLLTEDIVLQAMNGLPDKS